MTTISKITVPTEAQLATSQKASTKEAPGDAGAQQETHHVELTQPKGVKEVLKPQKQKELHAIAFQEKDIQELVHDLQKTLNKASKEKYNVGFREDPRAAAFVIEITDKDGNLVKQFPPEKVLNLRGKMDDLSGMVIDEMM